MKKMILSLSVLTVSLKAFAAPVCFFQDQRLVQDPRTVTGVLWTAQKDGVVATVMLKPSGELEAMVIEDPKSAVRILGNIAADFSTLPGLTYEHSGTTYNLICGQK